jgi:IclR family transcriptional regulator, acetate operon repressor
LSAASPSPNMPANHETSTYSIRSVERVVDLLELLACAGSPVSLRHLAEAADLPRSSAFRYLATLESRGYAVRDPDGSGYLLGPAFPRSADRTLDDLVEAAHPHLEALARSAGETVNLAILSGSRVSYLDIVESHRQVRLAAKVGDRDRIHSTALGKAIASQLSEDAVRHVLRVEGMPVLTKRTIDDPDDYLAALATVREHGYALDDRENENDGRCVAVALPISGLHAAVSLSAPASRFPVEEAPHLAEQLRVVAREITADYRRRTASAP